MNITHEWPVVIFRRDNEFGTFYTMGLSKKKIDGSYDNGYISCQFPKGVDIENKTRIYLKNAWLTFYKTKENVTVPYVFISEYETVQDTINASKVEEDPFAAYGETVQIDDNFLD